MSVIGERPDPEERRETQKKEAHDLIPQGMQRFDDRRDDVFNKFAAVADGLTLPHTSIVTEC
jgi:hypothetical protein